MKEKPMTTISKDFKIGLDSHTFNVSLATEIGLTEALILQHFYFMHNSNKDIESMVKDGRTWFFRSVKSMNETYPYLTTDKIRRAIERLTNGGLVFKADYNSDKFKKVTWYSLSDDVVRLFSGENTESNLQNAKRFSKMPNDSAKCQQDNNNIDNNNINNTLSAPSNEATAKTDRISYKEIVDKYNSMFQGLLPKVSIITDKRKAAIKARIKECGIESVDAVFNNILYSDFLTGNNDRGWTCDFDWIFKPSNFTKILEGNYSKGNGNVSIRKEYTNLGMETPYGKWIEWIKQTCPRVLMMKEILSEEGYNKIKDYSIEEKKRRFTEMGKYPRLLTEYTDPVSTFINWK